jgi:hypothetical protein
MPGDLPFEIAVQVIDWKTHRTTLHGMEGDEGGKPLTVAKALKICREAAKAGQGAIILLLHHDNGQLCAWDMKSFREEYPDYVRR